MYSKFYDTNEFLNYVKPDGFGVRHGAIMQDGFCISIQASKNHVCKPRIDFADRYERVELGYASREELDLEPYLDCGGSVYLYVPVEVVNKVIDKHGGIIGTTL